MIAEEFWQRYWNRYNQAGNQKAKILEEIQRVCSKKRQIMESREAQVSRTQLQLLADLFVPSQQRLGSILMKLH